MYINQQVIGVNEVNLTLIIVIINLMIIDYRMYINFWYPIILAKELRQEKPVKVKVLGMDLVVYKTTDGTINVLSDTFCLSVFNYISKELQADKEVLLAAVKNGYSLKHISEEIKNDPTKQESFDSKQESFDWDK